uniref:Uncharacterized protein n=1 Tax=Mimivirus LCMiAC01 TaxID=2506608 RepID=A0A481YZ68_9VIRU|nr:MAG: hypothetical protein LCMiAC01_01260 [Mimivirus LCMiAC01]
MKEGFNGKCPNCGYLDNSSCLECKQCGLCTTPAGSKQCIPGGSGGPLFEKDCTDWSYGN